MNDWPDTIIIVGFTAIVLIACCVLRWRGQWEKPDTDEPADDEGLW